MKAVLSKNKKGGYILSDISSGWCIGSTDHEYVLNHKGEQTVYKLSKQNCDKIFLELYDTEIEVEIEMETTSEGLDEITQPQYAKVPKLDENRCLILKNKYNMKPAVEWFVQQLRNGKEFNDELIQQAKEMEKEQIINACNSAYYSGETYYNETFKSE
jgi:hypothetical protein